ncbi:hypothetical protein HID58_012158 [Brassica napus]|uniref:Uncharacterized protein n=2 Tax=Brassica TaxID=3705 RepID=A0ABQ8E087_BRANA|nr:hypothetical protein HID58_012158 [Brassica napus]
MELSSRLFKSYTGSMFPEERIAYNRSHHRRSSSRLRKERRLGKEERETSINKTGRTPVLRCRHHREERDMETKAGQLRRGNRKPRETKAGYTHRTDRVYQRQNRREKPATKQSYLDLLFVKDRRERTKKREKLLTQILYK